MEECHFTLIKDLVNLNVELTKGTFVGFVNALSVWLNKPHVVNRRLCGSKFLCVQVSSKDSVTSEDLDSLIKSLYNKAEITGSSINNEVRQHADVPQEVDGLIEYADNNVVIEIVREMLPKQPERHDNIPELIIFDKVDASFTFYPLSALTSGDGKLTKNTKKTEPPANIVYKFSFKSDPQRIELDVSSSDFSTDSGRTLSLTWLQNHLLKKLARWSEEPSLKTSLSSLKLINLEKYNSLYYTLKEKYGLHFAKIWPEKTDPQKFVFEDVAIATYLLLLWEQDRERKNLTFKQSFVDLGCGNGLLVHILASEGHPGYGIDIRRRKIWDLYGDQTVLKEQSLTPSSTTVFSESDWLIGNHSDELTPWIPVMAARSSYTCNFFVLPCCHYDFDSRFSLKGAGTSQYRAYLDFVKCIGEQCGFTVEEDMLRIPSTKRVCFVGRNRIYPISDEAKMDEKRAQFIHSRCKRQDAQGDEIDAIADSTGAWASDFKPREKVEVSRNCVSLQTEIKDCVVKTVFDTLLNAEQGEVMTLPTGKQWRKGGKIAMSNVANLFDKSLLQQLKSECGGLQTLLKNYSSVFRVLSGQVELRDSYQSDSWGKRQKGKGKSRDVSDRFKTSLCWFNANHPDGCPLTADTCTYAHTVEELRPVKLKKTA